MTKWHGGKGSGSRKDDNQKQYSENWEKIFNKEKEMPIKLKPTARNYNKATRKTQIEHHYIKTTDAKILEDMLASENTRPKIKQKIRNELTRRNK
tara:strand:+ start:8089 stop:8373 length:285 start_codon:yes stop_codon:yes gene_type:complete